MKAGIVGVPLDELLKVAKSIDGINILPQKGFVKITGTIPGRAVYPQNNKNVGEVHFSGFAADPKTKIPGLIGNPKFPKPTKRVTHFLDQREGLSQAQILEAFRKLLSAMVSAEVAAPVEFVKPIVEVPAEVPAPEVIAAIPAPAEVVVTAEGEDELSDEEFLGDEKE